ncbi:hypothetical protein FORC55_2663 [Vibrio cholerae]|nr:hypothetical protein FORC55_2663 [Vibrio cholerae]
MIHSATRRTWIHTQTDTEFSLADANSISSLFKALWEYVCSRQVRIIINL